MRRLWVKQIQNTKERFVNIYENKDLFLSFKFDYDHGKPVRGMRGLGGLGGGGRYSPYSIQISKPFHLFVRSSARRIVL